MWKFIIAFCVLGFANLSAEVKVLAFAGSTRSESVNKKLLAEAVQILSQKGAKVTVIDLRDYQMPLYDANLENKEGMPLKAKQFRNLMLENQVILIASPEYNGSISGVLKNAIDWASRSERATSSRDAFKGKKFAIMSASPGSSGGAKGLSHLRSIIEHIGGTVIPQQVVVPDAYNAFDEQGHLKDAKIQKDLEQEMQSAVTV